MTDRGVTPFLWFDGNAEQAAEFYISVFPNSKITEITRSPEGIPAEPGSVLVVDFVVNGTPIIALNGGPEFKFTPALSLFAGFEKQEEVDRIWDLLLAEGTPMSCGWITDKFGVTWQIVPSGLRDVLSDPDPQRRNRAFASMMTMTKLDINVMRRALDGH